jgi:tetratricopeptide (TPR) repeat protein
VSAQALCAALASALAAAAATSTAPAADAREERFLELLRSYPQRPPADTFAQAEVLIAAGPFRERDRAEYWIGSARLAAGDRDGARAAFARLSRDYPGSAWAERSLLGLGDAAAQERRYGAALEEYARGAAARDPAVRELARISSLQTRVLRTRQRWAFGCGALAAAVAVYLLASFLRHRGRLLPLPAELRVVGPVLAVLALLSARTDPAPRKSILELCATGLALVLLSALRLRAASPRGAARALHVAVTLLALGCAFYAIVYRGDLVGMVLETFRAGPE